MGRIAPIALLIAVIAVALGAWALLRPSSASTSAGSTPASTSQPSADAKGHACAAFHTVTNAVALQTHADLGPDPVAVQAVAANARLAMAEGSSYLLAHLDPGTPTDLASAIRSFAGNLQDISMNALAGVPNDDPAQAGRLHDGQAGSTRIADLCK